MEPLVVPTHPGICPWSFFEVAVRSGRPVVVPVEVLLALLEDRARLLENNQVVREGWTDGLGSSVQE